MPFPSGLGSNIFTYHKKKYLLLLMKSFKTLFKHKITMEKNNSEHNIGPLSSLWEGWGGAPSPYTTLLQDPEKPMH
jgi:hypothetical protein